MSSLKIIMERLSKEEFSELCEEWDSGLFDEQMRIIGLPFDEGNFPDKYLPFNEEDVAKALDLCPIQDETNPCKHYSFQKDTNGEIVICFCSHPENLDTCEGNCTVNNCPILKKSTESNPDERELDGYNGDETPS